MIRLSRRHFTALGAAGLCLPKVGMAASPREILWEDLIPPGVPYAEIVGEGDMDVENDTWAPIYDENATKLNEALDGALIRMPGFIIPLEMGAKGVTDFMLVPYVGACIHTPPPPPNQLVLVKSDTPWPSDSLWDPVWVEGQMRTQLTDTELGETGYSLQANFMEVYVWE